MNSASRTRAVGAAAAAGHAACAILHALWTVTPWPLKDWPAWSRAFGGASFRVPTPTMITVAALFALAAYIVAAAAALVPRLGPAWLYRAGCWGIAVLFVLRAVVGEVQMAGSLGDPAIPVGFERTIWLYLTIYLPVFLILGVLTACVARRTAPRLPVGSEAV